MDHNTRRNHAKIVAILDLILTTLSFGIPVVLLIAAIVATEAISSDAFEQDPVVGKTLVAVLWIVFLLTLLITIIQFMAAIKLLNATQIGKDPLEAARLARNWRIVCITFTVFTALGLYKREVGELVVLIIVLIIRCIAIYVVHLFIVSADQEAAITLPVFAVVVPSTTAEQNNLPKYEEIPEKH